MRAGNGETLHAEAASVLDWWTLAGVDMAVGEAPRDWLAPPAPIVTAPPAPPAADAPPALPDSLDALDAWLATGGDDALLGPADRRLPATGPAGAPLMVLVDMPAPDDADAGTLMSGAPGRMLDAMLRAIGLSRDAVRLAALVPCRPAGGRLDADRLARLGTIARQHIALARPARVLLMGRCAAEALLDGEGASHRGRAHSVSGLTIYSTFSPTALVGAPPAMKAGAWDDLRLLLPEASS